MSIGAARTVLCFPGQSASTGKYLRANWLSVATRVHGGSRIGSAIDSVDLCVRSM